MLTPTGCATRRSRLWDALPEPCDVLVLADPQHLLYFANYVQSPFVFRSADAGALLILEPGKATLAADSMVQTFAARAAVDEVKAPVWYNGKTSAPHRQGIRVGAAIERLANIPGTRIGIERTSCPRRSGRGGYEPHAPT